MHPAYLQARVLHGKTRFDCAYSLHMHKQIDPLCLLAERTAHAVFLTLCLIMAAGTHLNGIKRTCFALMVKATVVNITVDVRIDGHLFSPP